MMEHDKCDHDESLSEDFSLDKESSPQGHNALSPWVEPTDELNTTFSSSKSEDKDLSDNGSSSKKIVQSSSAHHPISDIEKNYREYDDDADFPATYDMTFLTLVARDPNWIYAYWDVTDKALTEARSRCDDQEGLVMCLRMYDVTFIDFNGHNANHMFDVDIDPHARSWYINLWNDAVTYCAELGYRTRSGQFSPVMRSNVVTMQRKGLSWRNDVIWKHVEDPDRHAFVIVEPRPVFDPNKPRQHGPERHYVAVDQSNLMSYVTYQKSMNQVVHDQGHQGQAEQDSYHYGHSLDPQHPQRWVDGGMTEDEVFFRRLYTTQCWRRIRIGASEEMIVTSSASEAIESLIKRGGSEEWLIPSSASEQMFHVSGPEGQDRKFFFELWTDLNVYGRTEPDATVRMGDKIIPLQPDGTFKIHFSLPDHTTIPLSFSATSADQVETRYIITAGERHKTGYSRTIRPY